MNYIFYLISRGLKRTSGATESTCREELYRITSFGLYPLPFTDNCHCTAFARFPLSARVHVAVPVPLVHVHVAVQVCICKNSLSLIVLRVDVRPINFSICSIQLPYTHITVHVQSCRSTSHALLLMYAYIIYTHV